MKKEIIAIAAVAVISGMALASCGREVQQDTVTVDLPKVTAASDEQTTTTTGETTTGTNTTTTTASGSTTTTTETDEEDNDTETTTTATAKEDDDVPTIEPTEKPTEAPAYVAGRTDLSFGYGNIMSAASGVISSLGTPNDTKEAKGCFAGGLDEKIYYYNSVTVYCYISGATEYIYDIDVSGGDFSTDQGIRIGSSRSDVEAAYGDTAGAARATYESNGNFLEVRFNGDTVSAFEFYTR